MSCEYAPITVRCIRRAPEHLLTGPADVGDARLPDDRWLRRDLNQLHVSLSKHRQEHNLTRPSLAEKLGCEPAGCSYSAG
jgi:hypothetical protein